MFGQNWEDLGWAPRNRQGSDSANVRNRQDKRFLPIERVVGLPDADLQGGRLRTFDIGLGFLNAPAIQAGPQRGTGCEKFPPAATHVGQLDQTLIPVTALQVVWNQGEDIWRDLVDGCEGVLCGPNQTEDLQCIVFESVDLEI